MPANFKKPAAALAALLLASCAVLLPSAWQSERFRDHPLAGKIWDVRNQRFADAAELERALVGPSFVLLGETHDNVDHHRRQKEWVEVYLRVNQAARAPALALELFDTEFQPAIDTAAASPSVNALSIAEAARLNTDSPKWTQNRPLVQSALDHHLPLLAANLSRADARGVFAGGFSVLPARFSESFFSSTWNAARDKSLLADIVEGHCGNLPEAMAQPMLQAQRARDAVMADTMLASSGRSVILVAGTGHVRLDRGVPVYLRQARPAARILGIAMMEVKPEKTTPEHYWNDVAGEGPAFDYVWFTPAAERKEPCAAMNLDKLKAAVSPAAGAGK